MRRQQIICYNAAFTVIACLCGSLLAILAAYLYARLRGTLLPNGSIANGGPMSYWVGLNFRAYLPSFLAIGSTLGVVVGQAQFFAWIRYATDRSP